MKIRFKRKKNLLNPSQPLERITALSSVTKIVYPVNQFKFFYGVCTYVSSPVSKGAVQKLRKHGWGGEGVAKCLRMLTWGEGGVFEMLT